MRQCRTCKWLSQPEECHRYPPTRTTNGDSVWPKVSPLDSCGEWGEGSFGEWTSPKATREPKGGSFANSLSKVAELTTATMARANEAAKFGLIKTGDSVRQATDQVAVWGNAMLATEVAGNMDRWLRAAFDGPATLYDKAMDAAYNATRIGGGDHRLFDSGHDLIGAWEAAGRAAAENGDSSVERIGGYMAAL